MVDIAESINFGEPKKAAAITIIGVGGGGGNAVNRMYKDGMEYVDFIVCNSDRQDLEKSPIPNKIVLGPGLGCGSNPELGEEYAKEKTAEIEEKLADTQMLFIAAGMGGGTGTGAAPIIAEIAKKKDILTVGIVTLPYAFEGPERMESAIRGVEAMSQNVDSILVINNQTLCELFGTLKLTETYRRADETLATATKAIADIMQKTGFVNVDFNDVKAVLKDSGVSIMAAGSGSGENRAFDAVEQTLRSPLLNKSDIHGAKKILLNITSTAENELTTDELGIIMNYIRQKSETNVNITWGYMVGEQESGDEIGITMIATGFEMSDIPEFQKPEPKEVIVVGQKTQEPQQLSKPQTELFPKEEPTDITLMGNSQFDYKTYRQADDTSSFDNIPAWQRRNATPMTEKPVADPHATMSRAQQIEQAVADRIQGSAPSQFSIDKDSKNIIFGDNKYLNHNVD
ncbi:MAG: cell division protein FtsZ [Bacteroidales bacterium]|nr:cell division protein FtsZ [Bacteroidales bacterium]MBR6266069.1 cell division protein FtsZ [Bacteroidales bacterium]